MRRHVEDLKPGRMGWHIEDKNPGRMRWHVKAQFLTLVFGFRFLNAMPKPIAARV